MKLINLDHFDRQRAAAIPEYVLLLAILLPIFILIGLLLQRQALQSADESAEAVTSVVPCAIGPRRASVTPSADDLGRPNPQGTPSVLEECQ